MTKHRWLSNAPEFSENAGSSKATPPQSNTTQEDTAQENTAQENTTQENTTQEHTTQLIERVANLQERQNLLASF